jgi:hypothetical protein
MPCAAISSVLSMMGESGAVMAGGGSQEGHAQARTSRAREATSETDRRSEESLLLVGNALVDEGD